MARIFELMGDLMQAPSGNKPVAHSPSSRISELGIALPAPPTPLGAYVESSDAGNLLFLSGTLPVVNRKLAIGGRLG
jgi:enamine deaminase RidA (YjgF/YER057c/UK114 family)